MSIPWENTDEANRLKTRSQLFASQAGEGPHWQVLASAPAAGTGAPAAPQGGRRQRGNDKSVGSLVEFAAETAADEADEPIFVLNTFTDKNPVASTSDPGLKEKTEKMPDCEPDRAWSSEDRSPETQKKSQLSSDPPHHETSHAILGDTKRVISAQGPVGEYSQAVVNQAEKTDERTGNSRAAPPPAPFDYAKLPVDRFATELKTLREASLKQQGWPPSPTQPFPAPLPKHHPWPSESYPPRRGAKASLEIQRNEIEAERARFLRLLAEINTIHEAERTFIDELKADPEMSVPVLPHQGGVQDEAAKEDDEKASQKGDEETDEIALEKAAAAAAMRRWMRDSEAGEGCGEVQEVGQQHEEEPEDGQRQEQSPAAKGCLPRFRVCLAFCCRPKGDERD